MISSNLAYPSRRYALSSPPAPVCTLVLQMTCSGRGTDPAFGDSGSPRSPAMFWGTTIGARATTRAPNRCGCPGRSVRAVFLPVRSS